MSDKPPTIRIGEIFLSFQGEGSTIGALSIFIRVTGCTLDCSWCDSVEVWKTKGVEYTPKDLYTYISTTYREAFEHGAHLILTGGSPLRQDKGLTAFLKEFSILGRYIEVETEGVLLPSSDIDAMISRYNVSPKLANSGMAKEKRYNPQVLKWHTHKSQRRSIFKFVVESKTDVIEVTDIQMDIGIPSDRIWLMPLVSTIEDHNKMAPLVAEWAKENNYNFSPRLQIVLWNRTLGV